MSENEIITQEDPQMQLFSQLMEGILKKLGSSDIWSDAVLKRRKPLNKLYI